MSEAATLADARRQTAEVAPGWHDWILLDLMLPDGNGTELLRAMRQSPTPAASKVCVITGCGAAMLSEVETLHPDKIFAKPLDVDRLLSTLSAGGNEALGRGET